MSKSRFFLSRSYIGQDLRFSSKIGAILTKLGWLDNLLRENKYAQMQNANFWFIDRTSSLSFFVVRQAKRPRHTNDNARWFTALGHELYPFLPFPNLWRTSLLQSMFPWCTILLSPWSVKSCSFLISVWHSEAHWQFIRFSQNVHRKSDLLHQKQWGK